MNGKKNYVGIDVSAAGVRAVMLNEEFEVASESHMKLPAASGKESLASRIQKVFLDIPQGAHIKAVGISLPAIFEVGNKEIVSSQLSNLDGVRIYELISDRIKYPLFFFRRSASALLAEQAFGEAQDVKNAIYLEVGRNTSAGFLINGKIYKGANDQAGEINHMIIDITKEKRNGLGEYGTLVSGKGIQQLTGKSVYEILKGAKKDDFTTKRIVREITENLLTGMYNLKVLFDPKLFIINGEILENFPLFKNAFLDLGVEVVPAKLGMTAAAIGAGISAYNQLKMHSTKK